MNPTLCRPLSLLVLLIAFVHIPACENPADPDVRAAHDQLWRHIDIREGEKAVALLAPQSIIQYDQHLRFARSGTRAQVLALSPADRSEILTMRHRLSDSELKSMDGRGYIVHAVNKGWWIRGTDDARVELGRIRFQGNSASARLVVDGEPSNCTCNFDLIDGVWKLDWLGFDELFNSYITRAAEEYGVSENEILISIEERESGRPVPESIWDR